MCLWIRTQSFKTIINILERNVRGRWYKDPPCAAGESAPPLALLNYLGTFKWAPRSGPQHSKLWRIWRGGGGGRGEEGTKVSWGEKLGNRGRRVEDFRLQNCSSTLYYDCIIFITSRTQTLQIDPPIKYNLKDKRGGHLRKTSQTSYDSLFKIAARV